MNVLMLRSGLSLVLLAVCLPAVAQNVRYETQGKAFIEAEDQARADAIASHILGTPTADRGQVVFFRTSRGDAGDYALRENDTALVMMPLGSYYVFDVAPGMHAFAVEGESDGTLTLEVKPGRRHYVKLSAIDARPTLVRASAIAFLETATGQHEPIY